MQVPRRFASSSAQSHSLLHRTLHPNTPPPLSLNFIPPYLNTTLPPRPANQDLYNAFNRAQVMTRYHREKVVIKSIPIVEPPRAFNSKPEVSTKKPTVEAAEVKVEEKYIQAKVQEEVKVIEKVEVSKEVEVPVAEDVQLLSQEDLVKKFESSKFYIQASNDKFMEQAEKRNGMTIIDSLSGPGRKRMQRLIKSHGEVFSYMAFNEFNSRIKQQEAKVESIRLRMTQLDKSMRDARESKQTAKLRAQNAMDLESTMNELADFVLETAVRSDVKCCKAAYKLHSSAFGHSPLLQQDIITSWIHRFADVKQALTFFWNFSSIDGFSPNLETVRLLLNRCESAYHYEDSLRLSELMVKHFPNRIQDSDFPALKIAIDQSRLKDAKVLMENVMSCDDRVVPYEALCELLSEEYPIQDRTERVAAFCDIALTMINKHPHHFRLLSENVFYNQKHEFFQAFSDLLGNMLLEINYSNFKLIMLLDSLDASCKIRHAKAAVHLLKLYRDSKEIWHGKWRVDSWALVELLASEDEGDLLLWLISEPNHVFNKDRQCSRFTRKWIASLCVDNETLNIVKDWARRSKQHSIMGNLATVESKLNSQ